MEASSDSTFNMNGGSIKSPYIGVQIYNTNNNSSGSSLNKFFTKSLSDELIHSAIPSNPSFIK